MTLYHALKHVATNPNILIKLLIQTLINVNFIKYVSSFTVRKYRLPIFKCIPKITASNYNVRQK